MSFSSSVSLTLSEARQRAAQLSEVAYDLALDLTGDPDTFGVTATVSFASTAAETFLELTDATSLRVTVNDVAAEPAYDGRRIALTGLVERNRVVVEARVPYVTDGDGMHTFTDPADGERYVSAYLGMDVTQRVLPCFDQVDLKAPVTLAVQADPGWTVLANGRCTGAVDGRWTFATTPAIPLNMLVVCAGPWHSVTWEHAGLPFGWHARRSLAAELDRDAAELRRTTGACFDHYRTLFAEPYPFDSYDQVFAPGQNWGALETPGCVTYRDELLPRGRITDHQRTRRAEVVAHEMAHMWFGNLVTMRWWEDTWLNESFADYMGYRVAGDGAGFPDTLVGHEISRKPAAYAADVRRSTHPVAPLPEDVPDVDAAFNNFDAISYAKGNSVLRQLVTWLGDEHFLAGVNAHLGRHRFGNASLADFVDALDEASDRDVRQWVEVWLRRSGFDTIRVQRDGDVPVLHREGIRPHRVRVAAYDAALVEVDSRMVDLADEPVPLPDWAGLVVVPNTGGETFARVVLDEDSWFDLSLGLSGLADPLTRAVLWNGVLDMVARGDLAAHSYLELVAAQLPQEQSVDIVTAVLGRTLGVVVPHRVPADEAAAALDTLAGACATGLAAHPEEQLALALSRGLASTTRDAALLHRWLEADRTDAGLVLDPSLRWTVVHRLAETGAADAELIEAERVRDGGVEGQLGAAAALAARPTPEAKAMAWASITEDDRVSNRVFESTLAGLWSVEQADLLAPYVAAYTETGPAIARRRGQAFSQVVGGGFPQLALTEDQLAGFDATLADTDVPAVLRRHWEDHLDDRRG